MAFFEWNNSLSVHVDAMDEEHKQLIALMNQLHEVNQKPNNFCEIDRTLLSLVIFTKKHFADEEAYMASISFPELEIHKGIHRDLSSRLDEFYVVFKNRKKNLAPDIFHFLTRWLQSHIMGIDTKYGAQAPAEKKIA